MFDEDFENKAVDAVSEHVLDAIEECTPAVYGGLGAFFTICMVYAMIRKHRK